MTYPAFAHWQRRSNGPMLVFPQENEFRTGLSSNLVPWIDRFDRKCWSSNNNFLTISQYSTTISLRISLSEPILIVLPQLKVPIARQYSQFFSLSDQNNEYFLFARLEKESFKTLDKPQSFAHAQEIEKEAVLFAKEVNFHFPCQHLFSQTI